MVLKEDFGYIANISIVGGQLYDWIAEVKALEPSGMRKKASKLSFYRHALPEHIEKIFGIIQE